MKSIFAQLRAVIHKAHGSDEEARLATWKAYRNVRLYLVRSYFIRSPVTLLLSLGWIVLIGVVFMTICGADKVQSKADPITQVIALIVIVIAGLLIISLGVPLLAISSSRQINYSYIKLCNRFFDMHENLDDYQCGVDGNLQTIRELAQANASASWGAVTFLSVLFAIVLTLITSGFVDKSLPGLAVDVWLFAAVLLSSSFLFALVANADTVIQQAITLRCLTSDTSRRTKRSQSRSPWFR